MRVVSEWFGKDTLEKRGRLRDSLLRRYELSWIIPNFT